MEAGATTVHTVVPRTGWGTGTTPEPTPLIEEHALLGDLHTAALVAKDGSIDFLCLPDFDSEATFLSLLGTPENGRWKIAPTGPVLDVKRRYRGNTMVLETDFVTETGAVRLIDFMVCPRRSAPYLVRIVEGLRGEVEVKCDLRPRFASGWTVPIPLVRERTTVAIAGPDALYLHGGEGRGPAPLEAQFTVLAGARLPFVLAWGRPYEAVPPSIDADEALRDTEEYWEHWAGQLKLPAGEYREVVLRSMLALKACCYEPTGAIVAAPTFGLPETPGGERNWDYRFCWIRDASLTLNALTRAGLLGEAERFGNWLSASIGGSESQLQIMYGIRGERRLTEIELEWLSGYGGAKPVRIGNGAYDQFQLDVLGEFVAVLYDVVRLHGKLEPRMEARFRRISKGVATQWNTKDHGIWEMRGPKQHFVASKVAAWTVVDRWVRVIEEYGLEENAAPWVALRQKIFDDVMANGFDTKRNTFVQYYGATTVDASLLAIPMLGMLPADDPRVVGTVKAIEDELLQDGLVLRYRTELGTDGLAGEEGTFLACSFWLAITYQMMGRHDDARRLFERVINLRNDVGLLAEEFLTSAGQQIGNFPQAFSHLALVNCAYTLTGTAAAETASPLGVGARPNIGERPPALPH